MRCCALVLLVFVFDTGMCKYTSHTKSCTRIRGTIDKLERVYTLKHLIHSNQHRNTTMKYYTKQTDITIPIMMHLDRALVTMLSKEAKSKIRDKFKLLAKDILKDTESLFARQSLHQKIKFELLDVKIVRNDTRKVRMNRNVSKYLKSYCQWQGEKKIAKKKWFYSVMFTGLDLYYLDQNGARVTSSTGRGYARGICSNKNSCTMLEWHPENIAFILTHELAHSLGMSHDGPPHNECQGQRYIMNAKYNPKNPAKNWSICNKRELAKFLKSKQAWCLRQNAPIKLYNSYN